MLKLKQSKGRHGFQVSRLICRTTNQAPKIYGAPVTEAYFQQRKPKCSKVQPSYNNIRNNKDIELHCQIP
jgi:hypothetical protein